MSPQWLKIGLLLPAVAAFSACAAHPSIKSATIIPSQDVNSSLVAAGAKLQELALLRKDHPTWEVFRNDVPHFEDDLPAYSPWVFLEIRHREHLSTINGRPREFSSTITRTIRRELRH